MADVATLLLKVNSKEVKVGTVSLAALGKQSKQTAKDVDKVTQSSANLAGRQKRTASELSSSFKVIGRDLSRYVTLPFLAASAASLKFSKELTTGLGQVETLIAGTGSRIYELQDLVTGLSAETGVGFDNLTRGLYETISAFQDGADTAGRFEAAVRASVAGNADVLDSVKLISAVTKAYGDTSQEAAQKVTDLAFAAVKYGQTTFKELANAIQQVTANANRLGVSQEELFSVYSTLTGVTGDAANVTTQYNRALLSLSNPTQSLLGLFAQYTTSQGKVVTTGKEFIEVAGGSVQAFKLIYDYAQRTGQPLEKFITRQTGVIAVTALANQQFDTFNKKADLVANSVGAMEEAYFAATKGIDEFQRTLKQVKQTLASAGAEIGQILLPVVVTIAKQIANAAQRFSELDEKTQGMIIRSIALAAAIGPLLIAFGSLLRVIKLFGDLRILGASGALGFLANPAILAAVAAAVLVIGASFYQWYKRTMLQVEALKQLREASLAFNDVNSSFMELVSSTSDMTDAAERNRTIIYELSKTYGDDFASSLDLSAASMDDIYQEMLKIEALKFQQTLSAQSEQLKSLQIELNNTADNFTEITNSLQSAGIFERYGKDMEQVLADIQSGALQVTDYVNHSVLEYVNTLNKLDSQRTGVSKFFDDLQDDIEARTGGMLTLQRLIDEFGVEYTSEIVIVPKGSFQEQGELAGSEFSGGLNDALSGGRRLKTWADYFADITGIAGEAFANIERNAEGDAVGFARGSGKLAANAYAKAFADEMATQETIANAIGNAFTGADKIDILESQIDEAVKELTETLSTKINPEMFNREGLSFDMADLLSTDERSIADMLQVFSITDNAIQGIINTIKSLKSQLATENLNEAFANIAQSYAQLESDIMSNRISDEMYSLNRAAEAQAETAQDNIDMLRKKIEETDGSTATLEILLNIEEEKLDASLNTLSNITSALENAPSLAEVFGNAMYDAFKQAEDGASNMNLAIAAGATLVQGLMSSVGNEIAGVATEMGRLIALEQSGVDVTNQWDDAWGKAARAIADSISTLAMQVGLQLIGAGASAIGGADWGLIGLGLALWGGGLAGKIIGGYVQGTIDAEEQNAQGGVYSGSEKLTKYAHGGVLGDYVNSIVDKPTYFAHGSALMGEAGAEAIIPLTRTSSGDLGVQAVGGGSSEVNININNYASDSTSASVSRNSDGSIDVNIMKKMVASAIADGSADSAMRNRYGTKVRGIN